MCNLHSDTYYNHDCKLQVLFYILKFTQFLLGIIFVWRGLSFSIVLLFGVSINLS